MIAIVVLAHHALSELPSHLRVTTH
jgi:hypothetical protein